MTVLKLVRPDLKDTIGILRCLLERAERGEIVGLAICYRTKDRMEHAAFSGIYRSKPGAAVNAAMRLSWKLTQMQEVRDAGGASRL